MEKTIEDLQEMAREDGLTLANIQESYEMMKIENSSLKAMSENFDHIVNERAMKLASDALDASSTGMNEEGGSLVYRSN